VATKAFSSGVRRKKTDYYISDRDSSGLGPNV
jgi:hypothetical protein